MLTFLRGLKFNADLSLKKHVFLVKKYLKTLFMFQEASFSLAEAKFATGDFNHAVIQNVNKGTIPTVSI